MPRPGTISSNVTDSGEKGAPWPRWSDDATEKKIPLERKKRGGTSVRGAPPLRTILRECRFRTGACIRIAGAAVSIPCNIAATSAPCVYTCPPRACFRDRGDDVPDTCATTADVFPRNATCTVLASFRCRIENRVSTYVVGSSTKTWGRASMAGAIVLSMACLFALGISGAQGIGSESGSAVAADADAEAILDRGTAWLWSQREKDAGWGNDTHRVLLLLRLGNLSREDNVAPAAPLELLLSAKQMELEIVLLLSRHRESSFSPVRLARYTLALNAMCSDPRQFHGHDLIGTLQHHEPPADYEFALTTLAACNAQAHVRKRQIRRLLDIANAAQDHNVDTVAMVILALKCIVQDHRHRNLHHFVREPSIGLAGQQRLDGSFGDARTTALVMQALEEAENEPADNWNRSAALAWLTSQQRADGSFAGDVRATADALLGVTPRGLSTIRTLDCGQGLAETLPRPPKFASNGNERFAESAAVSPPSGNRNEDTSIWSSGAASNRSDYVAGNNGSTGSGYASNASSVDRAIMVNVSYTLWVGSNVNETYSLTVTAAKNETFYEVMLLAAELSPHFRFAASEWPNGHYVHTIAGYKEEPMSYHYWLLYRLTSPPDASSPPGNQLVAPGGVDDLQIGEGEHYLFWYKKL